MALGHYTDYSSSDEDETAEQVDDSSRADNTSEPESSTSEVIVASYEDFDDDSDSSFRGFIVESLESGVLLSDKSGDSD